MKIKEIRTSYNIIVTSQAEHLEVINYLESLNEPITKNGFTSTWDKVCFLPACSRWSLLSEDYSPYKLPSITFDQLKNMLFVEGEWVPEVGDWIIITRSDSNWSSNMDQYANTLVQITETNNGNATRFKNDGSWNWNLSDGHFRKAKPHEVDNEVVLFEDVLIEIAKTKYPVGTKFYPVHLTQKEKYSIITDDSVFSNDGDTIYSRVNGCDWVSDKHLKYGISTFDRVVYYEGKWADIITEESIEKPQATPKYKIGKWYKNTKDGDYGKLCADVTKARFPCTEYIHSFGAGSYCSNGTHFDAEWMDDLIEADLSEIQKWLPDGHVDKFGSSAFPATSLFSYELKRPADTIIGGAAILSPSGAYYFGSDPYKPDLDELKLSTIKLKTIEVRKLATN
jgi:hypothetical protein